MPALNFKKELAHKVKLGLKEPDHPEAKRQTIRKFRKDGRDPKAGQTLYLFTGQRTIKCKKLGEAICTETTDIIIEYGKIYLNSFPLTSLRSLTLAVADGFDTRIEFQAFFNKQYGLPFYGLLIKW